jgi:hypothetical protein
MMLLILEKLVLFILLRLSLILTEAVLSFLLSKFDDEISGNVPLSLVTTLEHLAAAFVCRLDWKTEVDGSLRP